MMLLRCDITTHPNYCSYSISTSYFFSSYEVLFPRGCYLIDDFGTSIGCSTTRRSKACPVQLVVLRHIHANLQFTQSSESPAN
ncbi:uncharacterized protein Smp_200130 [Schistosoma mansoni]|uniref:Smp_200130 n=1 Tax=Schistosoma mansoni TaxID=6183 RepID=G4VAT6_SCHMA|nr:uncharacterized protein Smp_200130 [Schistosoma mansoni]|eukprot:XP_018649389.1 uncharacterized protein Smp_200130 [Schistosoma mansoni]